VSGFLTYTFLQPLFFPVGLELAIVALNVLSINAAFVGMSLGVLLPLILPGVMLRCCRFPTCWFSNDHRESILLPAASVVVGVTGALVSARYVTVFDVFLAVTEVT
jgi:callose synthase